MLGFLITFAITKLYLDTSVFGGLFDAAFVDETKSFFKTIERDKLKICVSELVERELLRAPDHVLNFYMSLGTEWLDIDRDVLQLAKKYILAGHCHKNVLWTLSILPAQPFTTLQPL